MILMTLYDRDLDPCVSWAQFHGSAYREIMRLRYHRIIVCHNGSVSAELCGKQSHEIGP